MAVSEENSDVVSCRGDVGGDSHRRRRNIDDDAGDGGKSAKQGGRLGAVVVKSVEGSIYHIKT
ncbi:hypothetical protein Hanom_Chr16g01523241 [Helianthus anomalus]